MAQRRIIFSSVVLCFVVFLFGISNTHSARGMAPDDPGLSSNADEITSKKEKPACLDILREVIAAGGFEGEETNIQDESDLDKDFYWCSIEVSQVMEDRTAEHYYSTDSIRIGIMSYESNPEIMSGGNEMTRIRSTFHGFPALLEYNEPLAENPYLFHWYVPDHELIFWIDAYNYDIFRDESGPDYHVYSTPDPKAVAELYYSIVYNRMPELKLPPPDKDPANDEPFVIFPTDAVTEEPEIVVEPYGGETETPAEEEPEIVVVPYGGETEEPQVEVVPYGESGTEETTPAEGSFAETWDSEQARAIRSPYLPIVGGLIGGGAAWLFAQGAAKASGYMSSMAAAAPAPVVVPEVAHTPPELVTEPPELVSEPPPIQAEPPAAPAAPKTPLELGFNLVKDSLSGTATTLDTVIDNFSLADSPETMDAIRKAMKAWKSAPSTETLADYLKSLRLTNALKMEDLSDKLGKAGKALDLVEAGMKAQKICAARGYKGMDAVLATYAEVGKKALVWGITKNPVVGAIDTVSGSVTTILCGSDNKIDVGAVVDKAADAWDKVIQEAGELYNSDIVEAGKQYENEGKLNLVNRIKESVKSGSVSKEEGARRLRAVLDKFNQETPKL